MGRRVCLSESMMKDSEFWVCSLSTESRQLLVAPWFSAWVSSKHLVRGSEARCASLSESSGAPMRAKDPKMTIQMFSLSLFAPPRNCSEGNKQISAQ